MKSKHQNMSRSRFHARKDRETELRIFKLNEALRHHAKPLNDAIRKLMKPQDPDHSFKMVEKIRELAKKTREQWQSSGTADGPGFVLEGSKTVTIGGHLFNVVAECKCACGAVMLRLESVKKLITVSGYKSIIEGVAHANPACIIYKTAADMSPEKAIQFFHHCQARASGLN